MDSKPILAIDDCRINSLLLKHVLSKLAVEVDTAGTGEEGLAMVLRQEYRLIFLDIMLPGIDGFEVCRQIRSHPMPLQPKIILLTAMGEAFPHSRVSEVGADAVFFKPIVPSQILEIAREALSRVGLTP